MFCGRCGTWAPESAAACPACGEALQPHSPVVTREGGPEASAAQAQFQHLFVHPPRASQWTHDMFGGFWRRLAAALVDGIVLFFPQAITRVVLNLPLLATGESSDAVAELLVSVGTLVLYWLYSSLLESSARQATLGQQLLGLRVMDLEGRRISFARASARYFGQILSALICGVGYLFNLWTSRRQTLHDLIAGCVLVRPDRMPQQAPAQLGELA